VTGFGIGVGIGINPRGGKPAGPPPFGVKGVHFDGLTSVHRGGTLFSGPNSNFLFTTWFRTTSIAGAPALFWASTVPVVDPNTAVSCYAYLAPDYGNSLYVQMGHDSSAGGPYYGVNYPINSALDGNWHFIGFAFNLNMAAGAKIQSCTLDGVTVTPAFIDDGYPAISIDWSNATDVAIGGYGSGGFDTLNGDLSETYLNIGSYRDMTNPTQVANWYNAGQPADLGADGSNAGAGIPEAYLSVRTPSGVAADYLANRGSGGLFTVAEGSLSISALPNP
jgi:hypothetical protein